MNLLLLTGSDDACVWFPVHSVLVRFVLYRDTFVYNALGLLVRLMLASNRYSWWVF